jgi:hypothetical protein
LQFLFHKNRTIIVKKRRTPFHFSSRKYKVKVPRVKRSHWWRHRKQLNLVLNAQLLSDLSRELEGIEIATLQQRTRKFNRFHRLHRLKGILERIYLLLSQRRVRRRSRKMKDVDVIIST